MTISKLRKALHGTGCMCNTMFPFTGFIQSSSVDTIFRSKSLWNKVLICWIFFNLGKITTTPEVCETVKIGLCGISQEWLKCQEYLLLKYIILMV